MIKTYIKILIASFLVVFYASIAVAANAPVTTLPTVANVTAGTVSIPITVTNFSGIGAISLSFDYTYSGLHYTSGTPNPALSSFSINDNDLGNGKHRVIMGWYSNNPATLANGSTIMTVVFNYISGNDSLNWYDNGPSCEYADGLGVVLNDVPFASYYINGFICGSTGTPGTITGPASVCTGQTGTVYSINPMPNISGYTWTVPTGALLIGGAGTTSVTVDYPAGASSGNVTVNGFNPCGTSPTSTLAVSVYPLPVAYAGNDTTILYGTTATLHAASGGSGSFNYHWSPEALLLDPNVQNPQTVILTSTTVFTLTVTNQSSFCQNTDQVVVSISGGPLSVSPTVYPTSVCRGESAQLYANAGGGSGTYTYSWTCTPPGSPPWTSGAPNPLVTPDSSEVYHLTVSDGFNQAAGTTSLTVFQLPSATILGGDTLCGSGLTTLLTINLTGTPPWSFEYSDGVTTYPVNNQNTTPYLIVTGIPGIYTVFALKDAHCDGTTSGTAIVAVFPIPPTPTISQFGNELYSTSCCGNQWYKDNVPVAGETAQTITPVESGHYYDIVNLNSCVSDTSNDIYFVVDGTADPAAGSFMISPNPARESITILSVAPLNSPVIDIYSATGQLMQHIPSGTTQTGEGFKIDIRALSPGFYLVAVRSQEVCTVKKLIIE